MDINNTTVIKSPDFGNGLASTRDASPGDVLINIPSPYLFVVEQDALDRVCSQCLLDIHSADGEETLSLKRCGACKIPKYCSPACQKEHWKFIHKKECPVFKKLPRCPPTPVRALMQILWKHKYGGSYDPLWKDLEAHVTELEKDQKRWGDICLQAKAAAEFTDGPFTDVLVATQVLCRMIINSFRATLVDDTNVALCFEPTLAIANHSCSPNAVVEFDRRTVVLRTLNPIKAGEQILISYIDITQSKKTRQEALRSRYFFTCNCPACTENETSYHIFLRNTPTAGGKIDVFLPTSTLNTTAQAAITAFAKPPITAACKEASSWLITSRSKKPTRSRRFSDLWHALDIMKPLAGNSLFALQPYPNTLHELYHHHLNLHSWLPALVIYMFIHLNIDPYTYPQPHNPVRVTSLLTIARLLRYLCEMEFDGEFDHPDSLAPYGPQTRKAFLEIDRMDAYHAVCILLLELAIKSQGKEGKLAREAGQELQHAVLANDVRARHQPAQSRRVKGLEAWSDDGDDERGKRDAEAVLGALRRLGCLECLMEAVSVRWAPFTVSGPWNGAVVGAESEYTAE